MKSLCLATFVVLSVVFAVCLAVTPVKQCKGQNYPDLAERVDVLPCGKSRCKLIKGKNTTVVFRFKPEKEVKQLHSRVYATIAGIPLPFVGVDGVSACTNVVLADGVTPVKCPLAPGVEYQYTNVFPIHSFYPSVSMRVHWSLHDVDRDVICFEVPAVIA